MLRGGKREAKIHLDRKKETSTGKGPEAGDLGGGDKVSFRSKRGRRGSRHLWERIPGGKEKRKYHHRPNEIRNPHAAREGGESLLRRISFSFKERGILIREKMLSQEGGKKKKPPVFRTVRCAVLPRKSQRQGNRRKRKTPASG